MPDAQRRTRSERRHTVGRRTKRLLARTWNSGFDLAHDTYNSISTASDGRIYYVLSSEMIDTGAMLFCFDPVRTKGSKHLATSRRLVVKRV